jgi:hypothetical protein
MFARFRQVRDRLAVSIVAPARDGAKVRQGHVASLGSVPLPPSPVDRVVFWTRVHQRLATLGNRMDDKARAAILTAIHARIPIPTVEDQEAARNAGRDANAALFAILRDKHRAMAEHHRFGVEQETAAAEAIDGLEGAHAARPMSRAETLRMLRSLGMTTADIRHCRNMAALCELVDEDSITPTLAKHGVEAADRATRRAVRSLLAALTAPATLP